MKKIILICAIIMLLAVFVPLNSSFSATSAGVPIQSSAEILFNSTIVSSEPMITIVGQMNGATIEPFVGTGNERAGNVHYFPHVLNNLGNGTDNFRFFVQSIYPTTWECALYSDNNGNGIFDPLLDTPLNNPITLAEDGQKNILVAVRVPTTEISGAISSISVFISGEGHDGGYYNGANGTIYGGPDTMTITDVLTVETIRDLQIYREDPTRFIYLTWIGGAADIYCINSTFDATFANATVEARNVTSPYYCASIQSQDGQTRYYRAAMAGSQTFAPEMVGKMDIAITSDATLSSSLNQLSSPFILYSNNLSDVIGSQVTGANNAGAADRLWRYNPTVVGSYEIAWLAKNGTWYSGGPNPTTILCATDEGWHIEIRNGHPATFITLVGEVSPTDRTIPCRIGMNYVGTCFPAVVTLEVSDLWQSGMTGGKNAGSADRVWKDKGTGQENYDIAWLVDGVNASVNGKWYNSTTPTTITLMPGKGYWVEVRPNHTAFVWDYKKPF
jgi:hypothetical protein